MNPDYERGLSAGDEMTDQEIDTAGTEADDGHATRIRDTGVSLHDPTSTPLGAIPEWAPPHGDDPPSQGADAAGNEGPPRSPLTPETMHRAEDDARAAATSPDFSERPDRATKRSPREGDTDARRS